MLKSKSLISVQIQFKKEKNQKKFNSNDSKYFIDLKDILFHPFKQTLNLSTNNYTERKEFLSLYFKLFSIF